MLVGPRFGWNIHPVLSGSMEPALGVGGVIVTAPARVDEIQAGDIITFQAGEQRITHRVVDIVYRDGRRWFQTKGDANQEPDPNLVSSREDRAEKTIYHLPYLGYLSAAMKGTPAFLALVSVPALLLILLYSRDIWKGIQEEQAKRKPKVPGT